MWIANFFKLSMAVLGSSYFVEAGEHPGSLKKRWKKGILTTSLKDNRHVMITSCDEPNGGGSITNPTNVDSGESLEN